MDWNERLEELGKLPIFRFLDAIRDAFQKHKRVVIAAPAGSGKSTVIPLLLAKERLPARGRTGRVVVVEPQRIAATSLAARVADGFLGEDDEAKGVGRVAREVGARSWSQLLPHLPEAEELARWIQIQTQKGGEG
jgi:ATPase subunit of ABC transporter with duplicated ATPase domains